MAWFAVFTVLAAALAFLTVRFFSMRIGGKKLSEIEERASGLIQTAEKEAEGIRTEAALNAKERIYRAKQQIEEERRKKKNEFGKLKKHLEVKESGLERKADLLNKKQLGMRQESEQLEAREKSIRVKEEYLQDATDRQNRLLEKISGMSTEEAKVQLFTNLETEVREEASEMIKDVRQRAERKADDDARKIIALAMQNCASEQTAATSVTVVDLPDDDMKGRIIGRAGRNIRSFEQSTGVDLLIDDNPGTVVLSGFDPERREIARIALEKLIQDGRIHPARIEEIVEKTRDELEEMLRENGEQAIFEVGAHGVPAPLVKKLGKLKLLTAAGQNVLQHSVEMAIISGYMASLLGLDSRRARRAGLFHDIGMSVEQQMDEDAVSPCLNLLRKHGESSKVIDSIRAYAEEDYDRDIYAILLSAAHRVSTDRPGARREILESCIKRLVHLEEIAMSFSGVSHAFALQAGRELRVIVDHSQLDEARAISLADEIARKIEALAGYPGQVKVTVVREHRFIEYAK